MPPVKADWQAAAAGACALPATYLVLPEAEACLAGATVLSPLFSGRVPRVESRTIARAWTTALYIACAQLYAGGIRLSWNSTFHCLAAEARYRDTQDTLPLSVPLPPKTPAQSFVQGTNFICYVSVPACFRLIRKP